MKKYILDTTVCIALIKGNKKVLDTVYEKGRSNCSVSEITIAELLYGASKSGNPSHFNDVQYILDAFETIPIFHSLRIFADMKSDLERKGMRIDDFDLLIGATALKNSLTLVTHNIKHFKRIPGLPIEDWE